MADLVDDSLRCGQEFVRLDRAEIGVVGCVATIDDPWVEDVEIVMVDVWRAGWWVARVQLAQPVDLGNGGIGSEEASLECLLGGLLCQEPGDSEGSGSVSELDARSDQSSSARRNQRCAGDGSVSGRWSLIHHGAMVGRFELCASWNVAVPCEVADAGHE